jgi:glutathione S-transferase
MKLWGVSVSYFTGKLEAYLRYKGIPYEIDHPFADSARIKEGAGAIQVPILEREDGRFMSDTTPIIQELEKEYPDRPVMPPDPVVRFVALLIEDYADEWLWRAAMHYRWSYEHGRELLSRILADEVTSHLKVPRVLRRTMMKYRQRMGYVVGDGVTDETWNHVEQGYFNALRFMSQMLETRPYLLGATPSVADIGFMGPMMRHFSQDPDPTAIMRWEGPAVFDWVGRVWNAGATAGPVSFLDEVPADAGPLLGEIAETHMVQLRENAAGFARGETRFAMTVQGCPYRDLPVSRYRVYCLERLREHFAALDGPSQAKVKALLSQPEFALIWTEEVPANSGYDPERRAPYNKSINVFAGNPVAVRIEKIGGVFNRRG